MAHKAGQTREEYLAESREKLDALLKTHTLDDLIQQTMTVEDKESNEYWNIVGLLRRSGHPEVFEAAARLNESADPAERQLGIQLLGQLEGPFAEQRFTLLKHRLEQESDPKMLNNVIIALGHLYDPRTTELVVPFADHPEAGVRFGLVFALLGREDDLAINTLLNLMIDEDEDVRDWATFGIGSQIEMDTLAIRTALADRLTDSFEIVRWEAIVGLANRGDPRCIEPLIDEIKKGEIGEAFLSDAAWSLHDHGLNAPLVQFRNSDEWPEENYPPNIIDPPADNESTGDA